MTNQKGSLIISVFVIVVVALVSISGTYLFLKNQNNPSVKNDSNVTPTLTQTPDKSISNWKTYTGKFFSIKYPPTWIVEQTTPAVFTRIFNPAKIKTGQANGALGATESHPEEFIDILREITTAETPKQVFGKQLENCKQISVSDLHEKTYIAKDISMEFFDDCGEGSLSKRYIAISNGAALVVLQSHIEDYQGTKIENQILSTFKFLDTKEPTPTPIATVPTEKLLPTTGWVLASNQIFSLKYSSDLYNPIINEQYIQLRPKNNIGNDFNKSPNFLLANDYTGSARREWYLNHYSYYPSEAGINVFFTEKTLGSASVLEVRLKGETETKSILFSSGNKLIEVSVQGANLTEVETIVSTLKFN